jgi:glycerophosphoryl diester phosphodiesterase
MQPRLHPVVTGPLLVAHRGGSLLAPENTMAAFRSAIDDWGADMIEMDVHLTKDGHVVIMHDPMLDRTTNGTGKVADHTLDELRQLDAGYRFTTDGNTFPFRGTGVKIPTVGEVLGDLPPIRLTIEVKAAAAQRPLFAAIRQANAEQRVIAASLHASERTLFAEYHGPTSASAEQVRPFFALSRLRLGRLWAPKVDVMQLPELMRGRRIVSPRLIRDLHTHGIAVQVWTVNKREDMERLIDWGVDGVQSDRPDILADVMTEKLGRPAAPARGRASRADR